MTTTQRPRSIDCKGILGGWAPENRLHINAQRFRGGLVFKAHRLLYHSTLGLRVIKKKRKAYRWLGPRESVGISLCPYGWPTVGCFGGCTRGLCTKFLWSPRCGCPPSSSLLLSSLELSGTKVYEPQIRALLGTASHLCEVVVLTSAAPQS